jgi:heme exporter protein A
MSNENAIIEVQGLTKIYGFLPVLKSLDLTVARGEYIALLGPNGSGKSTLLRLLSGLSKPTQGTIRIGGWDIPQEAMAVRSQIGMVSHKPLLYENLTAYENLNFFGKLYNIEPTKRKERINSLLNQVGLKKRATSLVRTFSRGMQQRLSIARALLNEPDVLFFDEPYTGLDQDAGDMLEGLLKTAHSFNRTVVMTTHQLHRASNLASRAVILSRGKIAYDDDITGMSPADLTSIYTQATGVASTR